MARRSRDWNEGLAQDLRDAEFAREFLLAAMDEGLPIQIALGKVIRAMGVKEFAGKVRMASPNVLRAISPRHSPWGHLNRLRRALQAQAGHSSTWAAGSPCGVDPKPDVKPPWPTCRWSGLLATDEPRHYA